MGTTRKLLVVLDDNSIGELPIGDDVDLNAIGVWSKFSHTILPGESLVIDSMPRGSFISVKYLCSVFNFDERKTNMFEYTLNDNGIDLFSNIFGKVGSPINFQLHEVITGSNVQLIFTNAELFTMDINYAKAIFG